MQVKKGNFGYCSLSFWQLPRADIAVRFNAALQNERYSRERQFIQG